MRRQRGLPTRTTRVRKPPSVLRTLREIRWRGTKLCVDYGANAGIDVAKDAKIIRALGKYSTGSGMSLLDDRRRDFSATVPDDALVRVLAALKKIRGIRTRRLVQKWVVCR